MQTPEPKRLFFALWPGSDIRAQTAATAKTLFARHSLTGRRSGPRLYHLTLFFLGDKVPATTEAAARKLAARIDAPPFRLRLDQAGSFPNPEIPIWLGASAPPAELKHLDQSLRTTLRVLPLARQPSFKPHLTIMRNASEPLHDEPVEPIEWWVDEFVLIQSFVMPGSVHYEVLERFPLRGSPLKPEPKQTELF